MSDNPRSAKNAPRNKTRRISRRPQAAAQHSRPPILHLAATAAIFTVIALYLHSPWIASLWLLGIGLWTRFFWRVEEDFASTPWQPTRGDYFALLAILAAAATLRLYRIADLPLGPYIDEILTMIHSLELSEKPFDLFGHTPLLHEGWVETPNLYLYFDLVIVKLFGVSYLSMKLFSVIPGIVTCGGIFLICRSLFDIRIALWVAALFTAGHWPVRLSRYGWDVSFLIMTFSLAIFFLLVAIQNRRTVYAYLSGVTIGISLYSYAGARVCFLALALFLIVECAVKKERWLLRQAVAFATGATIVAFPLLCYYLTHPNAFWVRASEINVFNSDAPLLPIFENLWRHVLMFNISGGNYARDNSPGTSMLDPITGLLFVVGLVVSCRELRTTTTRLIAWTFVLNFVPGIFSVSQEGAPYVYRTAAVIIPTYLLVGVGLRWLSRQMASRVSATNWRTGLQHMISVAVLFAVAWNSYLYFYLESKNRAAMRTMAFEARLIGAEMARDDMAVIILGRDTVEKIETEPRPGEVHAKANPAMGMPLPLSIFALVSFSGRYDTKRSVKDNLTQPRGIAFLDTLPSDLGALMNQQQATIIFNARNQASLSNLSQHFPSASINYLRNIHGDPILGIAIVATNDAPGSGN